MLITPRHLTYTLIKRILVTTIMFAGLAACAQTKNQISLFQKEKAAQLIIGEWKGFSITITSANLTGFNEMMDNPVFLTSLKMQANLLNLIFTIDKKLTASLISNDKTAKYEMTDSGMDFISLNEKKQTERKKFKITLLTEDSLIYTREVKATDPSMATLVQMMNVKGDTSKTIVFTYTVYRVREAKAPWSYMRGSLPEQKISENLVANNSTIFLIRRAEVYGGSDSIFASNDFGIHWSSCVKGLPKLISPETSPTKITVSAKKIFVGTQSGVFSSEDNGNSWLKTDAIVVKDGTEHIILVASSGENIVALVDSSLYMSKDDGITWKMKSNIVPQEFLMAQLHADGTNIIVEGISGDQRTFIEYSQDYGESWNDVAGNVDETKYPGLVSTSFIINNTIFMSTQYGLLMSTDKGVTWFAVVKGLPGKISCNSMLAKGENIFLGSSGGVYLSVNNGESWSEVNNRELRTGVTSLAIIDSNIVATTAENKLWKASINELVASAGKTRN